MIAKEPSLARRKQHEARLRASQREEAMKEAHEFLADSDQMSVLGYSNREGKVHKRVAELVKRYGADPDADATTPDEIAVRDGVRSYLKDPSQNTDFHIGMENGSELPYARVTISRTRWLEPSSNELAGWVDQQSEEAVRRVGGAVLQEVLERTNSDPLVTGADDRYLTVSRARVRMEDEFRGEGHGFRTTVLLASSDFKQSELPRTHLVALHPDGSRLASEFKDGRWELTDRRAPQALKDAYRKAANEVWDANVMDPVDLFRNQMLVRQRSLARHTLEVLSEIRPMGGTLKGTPRGNSTVAETLREGIAQVPRAWLQAANKYPVPLKVVENSPRGQYRSVDNEIKLSTQPGVAVHELMHMAEARVPGIVQLEQQFWDRRTFGESSRRLKELVPGSTYEDDEVARPDRFFDPYVGKDYKGRAFEVMSMGVQHLSSGQLDLDYQMFVLGVLAAV